MTQVSNSKETGEGSIDQVNGTNPNSQDSESSVDSAKMEPLAIVGLSFKFPGGMETAESLWEGLATSHSAWSPFPESRLNFKGVYDPDTERLNSFPLKGAHFVKGDISAFDAPFFTIGPGEAAEIDPQSRTLLETTYRALENAGIPMEKVANSNTSVYTGSFGDDYKSFAVKDPQFGGQYSASSVSPNMLANRISWYFNLRGESINMDTACSSTLVAFHTACQRLRDKESSMVIVAGSNLFFSPDMAMSLNNQNFLSPDGRCWSFDQKANGYGRGEGFGVLILKRLCDALENKDPIRAVIRATGTNQDGRTPGIVQPSRNAQSQLIRDVYKKAGLDMAETRYVEAHGTGTPIGDPIEAGAIADAFGHTISAERPLFVGTIKSNIGHLEGASGIAGLIKSVLMLERGMIPGIAGLENVNPSIATEHPYLKFPSKLMPWPSDGLRRLSINSFGFGGTNAHVVMENACDHFKLKEQLNGTKELDRSACPNNEPLSNSNGFHNGAMPTMLVLSSQDENGIKRLASVYQDHWARIHKSDFDDPYISSLAYTLSSRRSALLWRSFVTISSKDELTAEVQWSRAVRAVSGARLAFCFTGQGAQWYAMAREIESFDVFSQSLREISELLKNMGCPWSLHNELSRDRETSRVNSPQFSQPLCTAIQIALIDVLESLEVHPSVVFGHSSGEIAAAYCVGALDKRSAMKVAYHRGQLALKVAQDKTVQGGMLSAALSSREIESYLDRVEARFGHSGVSVGCINSPHNVTVTGNLEQIKYLNNILEQDSVFGRILKVDVAYHSHHMNAIASAYSKALGNLWPRLSVNSSTMVSSVTGNVIANNKLCQSSYWVQNMVSQVRFLEAITCAASLCIAGDGQFSYDSTKVQFDDILEIGPHSALQAPIRDTLKTLGKTSAIGYHSALVRNVNATTSMLEALGNLYCRGHAISIKALHDQRYRAPHLCAPLIDLPEYPFDHSRSYWRESRLSRGHRFRGTPRNDFLGTRVPDWNPHEGKWRRRIKLSEDSWIEDHKIANVCILPAAAMLVMAIEAAKCMTKSRSDKPISGFVLQDVVFTRVIAISADPDGTEVEFYLQPRGLASDREITWSDFHLYTTENENWVEVCRGRVRVSHVEDEDKVEKGREHFLEVERHRTELSRIRASCSQKVDMESFYQALSKNGIDFGLAHRTIESGAYNHNMECIAEIALHQWKVKSRTFYQTDFTVHPTTLDGIFQMGLIALAGGATKIYPSVVASIRKLWVAEGKINVPELSTMSVYDRSAFNGFTTTTSDAVAFDSIESTPIITLEGLEGKFLEQSSKAETSPQNRRLCWNFDYRPDLDLLTKAEIVQYVTTAYSVQPTPYQLDHDVKLLLYLCILRTLKQLTESDIANLTPHHQKFFQWMQYERSKLYSADLRNGAVDVRKHMDDESFYENLRSRLEHENARGKLYAVLSNNLLDILKGKSDALGLMFQTTLVKDYYRELYKATNGLFKALAFLDIYTHKHPNMRILEIGAGTGGMTNNLLDVLAQNGSREARAGVPRFAHYTFTDISPGFFEGAVPIFRSFPDKVTFKVLDIERDPVSQGFEEGSYDCIIADNVLHATQDLEITVKNVRKLLKPGGKLALFELTVPEVVRTNFAFGLLPGWWRFNDQYRHFSAGVSDSMWDKVLKENGFSGIDYNFTDYDDLECHEHSALISTACAETLSTVPLPRTVVILDTESDLQKTTCDLLCEILRSTGNTDVAAKTLKELTLPGQADQPFCIMLLELDKPFLRDLTEQEYEDFKTVLQAYDNMLWVCRGGGVRPEFPEYALIQGALRGLRMEDRKRKFVTLSLEAIRISSKYLVNTILEIYKSIATIPVDDCEQEYVERDGKICIDRIVEADYVNHELAISMEDIARSECQLSDAPPITLSIGTAGLLDTLEFVMDNIAGTDLASDEIEIKVKVSGVNFRDCLIALGRMPGMSFGFECSGEVHRIGSLVRGFEIGDKVCASTIGTYQTYARCRASNVILIRNSMSFADAAAIPVVFTTAYYALVHIARIQKGESILIHSAAGGTGQAAIQVAKLLGAEIFVTVGSEDKKHLLMDLYKIPEDHIFYSRNNSFVKGVQRLTRHHNGVDVILNSLSGDLLVDTWHCIAPFGRFLELGKKDILANGNLPMLPFSRNASFHAIDLNEAGRYRPSLLMDLRDSISALLADNKIHPPQPVHHYAVSEVERAFRYLQSGKNTGKTVIEFNAQDIVKTGLPKQLKWSFAENATYIIAGGLGGIGRSTAQWMADRGVRNLVLLSRQSTKSKEASQLVCSLEAQGVRVLTPQCDISNSNSLKSVLDEVHKTMPPIKGCIQSAMVLKNKVFGNMTYADWTGAIDCKVPGTWNLHTLLPKGMDFFIMYSSIAGGIGGTASTNYSAGCAYQDALAHYRNRIGEKATTFNLGVMMDDGVLRDNETLRNVLLGTGYLIGVKQKEMFALLEHYCDPSLEMPKTPLTSQVVVGLDVPSSIIAGGAEVPTIMKRPFFRQMWNITDRANSNAEGEAVTDIVEQLRNVASDSEAAEVIASALMQRMSHALAVPVENLDSSRAMHVYGVDSLVAVELKNWFNSKLDAEVAVFEILGEVTIEDIAIKVVSKSKLVAEILSGARETK